MENLIPGRGPAAAAGLAAAQQRVADVVRSVAGDYVCVGEHDAGPVAGEVSEDFWKVTAALLDAHAVLRRAPEPAVDARRVLVQDGAVERLARVAGVHAQGGRRVKKVYAIPEGHRTLCSAIAVTT